METTLHRHEDHPITLYLVPLMLVNAPNLHQYFWPSSNRSKD